MVDEETIGGQRVEDFLEKLATMIASKISLPVANVVGQLAELRPQLIPDYFYVTYPQDGTKKTVGAGITQIDFEEGKVYLPDGTEEYLSDNLRNHNDKVMRAFQVDVNQDVVIWLDNSGKKPVDLDDIHGETYQNFKYLYIETTKNTSFDVWASNNPDSYLRKFKPIIYRQTINQYGQLVFPNSDVGVPRMTLKYLQTASGSYVPIGTLTIGTQHYGVLMDVSVTPDTNAQFKLTIGTHLEFRDVKLVAALSIPFLPHALNQNTAVNLEVMSTSGTIEVNGLIVWKEVSVPGV